MCIGWYGDGDLPYKDFTLGSDAAYLSGEDYWEGFGQRFTLMFGRESGSNDFVVPLEDDAGATSRVLLSADRELVREHYSYTWNETLAHRYNWQLECDDGTVVNGMAPYNGTIRTVAGGIKCTLRMDGGFTTVPDGPYSADVPLGWDGHGKVGDNCGVFTAADWWEGFGQRFTLMFGRESGSNDFTVPLEGDTGATSRVFLSADRALLQGSGWGQPVSEGLVNSTMAHSYNWRLECTDGTNVTGMAPYNGTIRTVVGGTKCTLWMEGGVYTTGGR